MNNVLLVTPPDMKATLSDALATWKTDATREQWNPFVESFTGNAQAFRAYLLAYSPRPACVFLLGDVPAVGATDSPDGHDGRRLFCDYHLVSESPPTWDTTQPDTAYFAALHGTPLMGLGRVTFNEASPYPLTRAYFEKRHRYSLRGATDYGPQIVCDNYLLDHNLTDAQMQASMGDLWPICKWWRQAIQNDDMLGEDGLMDDATAHSALLHRVWTGGSSFGGSAAGLYQYGSTDRLRRDDPRILFFAGFASYLADWLKDGNTGYNLLALKHCLGFLYDYWGMANLGGLASGGTWGEAARQAAIAGGTAITNFWGDPTLTLDLNWQQQVQTLQSDKAALQTQVVTLQAQITSMKQAAPPTPVDTPTSPAAAFQVNCGSVLAQAPFVADSNFSGGNYWATSHGVDTTGVTNAAPAACYQSCRTGTSFAYSRGGYAPGTSLKARLHFCEPDPNRAGTRLTNVTINGTVVLNNFDPATAAGGTFKAVVKEFALVADSTGAVNLAFSSPTSYPLLCALEIL